HYATQQAVELAALVGDRAAVDRAGEWAARTLSRDVGAFETALLLSVLLEAGRDAQEAIEGLVALQDADGGWPSRPIMRIPLPGDRDPDRPRRRRPRGIVVRDQHRTFTSAACVAALARATAH